jgi:uncharacterized iron-regulated protein
MFPVRRRKGSFAAALAVLLWLASGPGCTTGPAVVRIADSDARMAAETGFATADGRRLSWEALVAQLAEARIVYVGEEHANAAHHALQARLIRDLARRHADLLVGMEMFDFRYDGVLARWSRGELDLETFLRQTHWYANWRFDHTLYQPVFEAVQESGLPLVGLNLPFHLPAKIREGGLDSLLPDEQAWLPEEIDLTVAEHRAALEDTFRRHRFPSRVNFDFFYQAQCAWDETMAAAVARNLGVGRMVVLCGRGHMLRFGIPDRVFRRNGVPFRTLLLAPVGTDAQRRDADYIWATP